MQEIIRHSTLWPVEDSGLSGLASAADAALPAAEADWESYVDGKIIELAGLDDTERLRQCLEIAREARGEELVDLETMGYFGADLYRVKLSKVRIAEVTRLRTALGV